MQTQGAQHATNGKAMLTEATEPSSSGVEPDIADLAGIQVTMMLEQLCWCHESEKEYAVLWKERRQHRHLQYS
jgi:hypothetical protein